MQRELRGGGGWKGEGRNWERASGAPIARAPAPCSLCPSFPAVPARSRLSPAPPRHGRVVRGARVPWEGGEQGRRAREKRCAHAPAHPEYVFACPVLPPARPPPKLPPHRAGWMRAPSTREAAGGAEAAWEGEREGWGARARQKTARGRPPPPSPTSLPPPATTSSSTAGSPWTPGTSPASSTCRPTCWRTPT